MTRTSHQVTPYFFRCYLHQRTRHSFPTRRSSDLFESSNKISKPCAPAAPCIGSSARRCRWRRSRWSDTRTPANPRCRSEEHTSELQSLRHLVCRLLLEKKKQTKTKQHITDIHTTQ